MKPSVPSATSVNEPPPAVAETADTDTQDAYDQSASRRRGLLSTILSRRAANAAANSQTQSAGSQSTLG